MTRILVIFAVSGFTIAGPQALAQQQRFSTVWMVADRLTNIPTEPVNGPERLAVKSGDIFLAHRLLPIAAARLETDLTGEQGNIPVAKGTEMFSLNAGSLHLFCDTKQSRPGVTMALLSIRGGRGHVCAIDSDGNRVFESYFTARGLVKGLPSLDGVVPKKLKSAVSGTYKLIEPTAMSTRYFVEIEYEGKPLLYDRRNFRITFGEGEHHESLTNWSYLPGKSYPQSLGLLGSRFTIIGEKDGTLDIQVDYNMPKQPFNVSVSFQIR